MVANSGDSIHGLHDAAIIAVASDATMLRVSELSALNVGDMPAGDAHY